MINLFRNIRHRMLTKNKAGPPGRTGRYLKYAIGEVLLVVVGILLALQINNWNELKKQDRLKGVYITRLLNDVESDTVSINYVRSEIEKNQNVIKNLIDSINLNLDDNVLEEVLQNYFSRGWIIHEFVANDNTYTDLSQTGNMNIIKNTDLIDEIIQYYGYLEQVDNSNNVNKNWITPLDLEVAKLTAAFELDPSTRSLFTHKNKSLAIKNIQSNAELLERNAAGHFWINESLSGNLQALKGVCNDLINSLKEEK